MAYNYKQHILAYWEAAQTTKGDEIAPQVQRQLAIAGRMGYVGLIYGVFAAHKLEYGGVSSSLPGDFSLEQRRLLGQRAVCTVATPSSTTRSVRMEMRRSLEEGRLSVESQLAEEAERLGVVSWTSGLAPEVREATGTLYIQPDDETIPDGLWQLLERLRPQEQIIA